MNKRGSDYYQESTLSLSDGSDEDEEQDDANKRPRISFNSNKSDANCASSSSSDEDEGIGRSSFGLGSSGSCNWSSVQNSEVLSTASTPTMDVPQTNYSNVAQKLMSKMGYKEGLGLGKHSQGRVAPVEASHQRGRRGLGLKLEGFEPARNLEWDLSQDFIEVEEEVTWLPQYPGDPPDLNKLTSWMQEGTKKLDISDETQFCRDDVMEGVISAKSIFDQLDPKELMRARTRCNPFETLSKLFFQNRAALKMANMDAIFDWMFTRPKDEKGESLVGVDDLLYFADVCAAPGGFSEYVLWRRKTDSQEFCDAKGFGFTLRENDFKLHDFFAAPSEFFEPHYGINGLEGTGNVYESSNQENFIKFVKENTKGQGIHFMMADGGFGVEGQENIQEILSKQLYLCQFLIALGIVRTDGNFVCKLFDVFTPFSVGLIYLMYRSFKYVSIHKPNTSRPANSERYIICKYKKENVSSVLTYMMQINQRLNQLGSNSSTDVLEIVPMDIIKGDEDFYNYIVNSNNDLGERQIIGLRKIQAFCRDIELIDERQAELRTQSLERWGLPDKARIAPVRSEAKVKFLQLMSGENTDYMAKGPDELHFHNLNEKIHSAYDYCFMMLASAKEGRKDRAFYLGLGGCNIFSWDGRGTSAWRRLEIRLELPPDTLVYAEIVQEHRGEFKAQRKINTLHLIDGLILNGKDIRNMHIVDRHRYLCKFASALNKPSRPDYAPMRCKQLFKLEMLQEVLKPPRLDMRVMKGGPKPRRVFTEVEGNSHDVSHYTIPTGVIMLKATQDPWMMAFSRSQNRKYWFNTHNRQSTFDCLKEVIAPFKGSFSGSCIWWWEGGIQVLESDTAADNRLHIHLLAQHIKIKS
ncbi:unnamed protein product [Meganyctiphanes norvegica]|uniref:Cap-specific mRNA (nucleoside-2'-O-)-methyltransferase 1 n=1 Tax=Meganyctiphanes norvegica TaxID=48144 RepID=A0AAV2QMP8_MEGNR